MTRRRRTLLLGPALVLLPAVGIGAALLWPSDAETMAATVRVGMNVDQVRSRVMAHELFRKQELVEDRKERFFVDRSPEEGGKRGRPGRWWATMSGKEVWTFRDGSALRVCYARNGPGTDPTEPLLITSVEPLSYSKLTRLRRTLARALPFLGE